MTSPSCLRATVLRGSRDPRMPQIRPSNSIGPPVPCAPRRREPSVEEDSIRKVVDWSGS
jgi:hypothetical protein